MVCDAMVAESERGPQIVDVRCSLNTLCWFAGASYVGGAGFGDGEGPIVMDYVGCQGNETRIVDCYYSAISSCAHSGDVGVICLSKFSLLILLFFYQIQSWLHYK